MSPIDLHPDIVKAINQFAETKLGRKYGRAARSGRLTGGTKIGGKKLLAKTSAGEAGGRSNSSGATNSAVSSAGARGAMQFIPSTRDAYKAKYGVDAWGSDLEAVKAAALHHLSTGVPGYNPGMPSYTSYILGQKINPADIQALRTGAAPGRGAGGGGRRAPGMTIPGRRRPQMSLTTTTTPGTSMAPERQAARRELLLSGDINLKSLLQYATQKKALRDIPGTAETNLDVRLGPRGKARVQGPRDTDLHPQHVKAGLFEVERDGWKGSQSVGRGLVKASGLPVGSEKRSTVNTASGNVSDHYEGNKDSYAWDLSVTGEHGTKVARKLARMLGSKWQGGSWLNVVKKIEGRTYRFQLGWNVPDHYDHIHMGVDRVDTPG